MLILIFLHLILEYCFILHFFYSSGWLCLCSCCSLCSRDCRNDISSYFWDYHRGYYFFSTVLLALFGKHIDFSVNTELALKAGAMVIIFATIVCVAAAVSGDNMQDLKAGQIVEQHPGNNKPCLLLGLLLLLWLFLLFYKRHLKAYGIGDVMPRPAWISIRHYRHHKQL